MCGIAGIFAVNTSLNLRDAIGRMQHQILHRGPDGEGIYLDSQTNLILGHRRLAIIDPQHGAQPLTSHNGRYTVTFNGAIYNYLELRRELISRGHPITSYCDTEVIPYAYAEWGEDCVNHFRGMFAFAVWDVVEKVLFCARDRVGIKPFYYFHDGQHFVFASEIKAILSTGLIKAEASTQGLQDYVTFQFCLEDTTLFKNIFKLEPGYCISVRQQAGKILTTKRQYWDVNYETNSEQNPQYYIDNLVALLEESVQLHLRSDVPLGAHLSGGLDSSTVVCLAAKLLKGSQFKTFTGAFREGQQFDETAHAKAVAEMAGCDYHETYIPGTELSTVLPHLIRMMDEPVAGPGLIPQYYVSKLAADQKAKVVLGGQGGDELYVGYARYFVAYLEKCLAASISPGSQNTGDNHSLSDIIPNLPLLDSYKPMIKHFFSEGLFGNDDERYFRLTDRSEDGRSIFNPEVFTNSQSFNRFQTVFNRPNTDSYINKMTYFDLKASLPALLHVEDRTSMAVSLESRVPLLDHKLVEFIATVPSNLKFANGKTKHLFREAVKNLIPKQILDRKDKMGFPVPLNQWFQGTGRDFVQDILFSQKTQQRGLFDIKKLRSYSDSNQPFSRVLWGAICLELWHREFIDK